MEHITIKEIGNDLFQLTPEQGYKLYNEATQRTYSEAVCSYDEIKDFKAVAV